MIPNGVPRTSSPAEQLVYRQLSDVEVAGWDVALHSMRLPVHVRKRVCEIDFLLVGPRGLLGLEVKGGEVSLRERVWHSRDLHGRRHRLKESPVDQLHSAMFALEGRLRAELDKELVRRTVFGQGLVFPDCAFDVASVEWEAETVLDQPGMVQLGWAKWLDGVGSVWEGKPGNRSTLSGADVSRYLDYLRPDYEQVRTLGQLSSEVDTELATLTEQQYRALDLVETNSRILFEGGAGTGKTMLAAEMCRRLAESGDRVLLTCRSGVLAAFIAAQPGLDGVTVLPFDRVTSEAVATFDAVVVDEAQDVVNGADLDVVERVLSGGLAEGRWVLLLDSNNQRGLVGSYEDAAMTRLAEHRPARFKLKDNCRNTVEIVTATRERTGADLGVTTAGHGQEVVVFEQTRADLGRTVADLLDKLEADQVPLNQVVLLSPRPFGASVFAELPSPWRDRVDILDLARMRKPTGGRVGFARIAEFKGLESPFVVVESLPDGDCEAIRSALYVGMTRARAALWVVCPQDGGAVA
nr:NERD domain-containing protein/DEAD/DEAH box helicase [Actinokineospora sp. NBRC 105648]